MSDLAKRIKELRLKLGLSQEELAYKTGYTDRSSIARIESGRNGVSSEKLILFATALGVSPAKLISQEAQPKPEAGLYPTKDEVFVPDFYLVAKDDAMKGDSINKGDSVFFIKTDTAGDGNIVAIIVNCETVIRRVRYLKEGQLVLETSNNDFPDMVYKGGLTSNTQILGIAAVVQHKLF